MGLSKDMVREALRGVPAPGGGDVVTGGVLTWCAACDGHASVKLRAPVDGEGRGRLADAVHVAVENGAGRAGARLDTLVVEFVDAAGAVVETRRYGGDASATKAAGAPRTAPPAGSPVAGVAPALAGVKNIVAVGAGKGGVGKSTIALNLAVGLARRGHAAGLLDADIYGPSMPTMLGLLGHEAVATGGELQPFVAHGVRCMTMGKLVDPERALIWRGPMAHGAFKQMAEQTRWGELDYLVVDLPPGTGDVSLTMAQVLRLRGAVLVCTPQKVAQDDAVRAAAMFRQLGIPLLGVVENMSYFVGDDGKEYDIFGRGGAEKMAARLGAPFLGGVPITIALREASDRGDPTANFTGTDPAGRRLAAALGRIVAGVEAQAALGAAGTGGPTLTIS